MKLLPAVLTACLATAAHAQHAAHEHGVAELRVAVAGRSLQIEYASPLDTLVGFEHAPADERQRRLLAEAETALRDGARLFRLPAAAACVQRRVELSSPWPAQGHGGDHEHGGHAEIETAYVFECARPQALDAIEVTAFDVFPRTREIRAERATAGGQGAATLTSQQRRLPL